ncbi:MAG TPA: biotin/lipoyl-binding protein, partial [Woeseiaceae bacterium]|nr:biotin/lipoyl-binding protein [Woeseiaceae bacterium]
MKTPNILTGKLRWIVIAVVAIAVGGLLLFWLLRDSSNHDVLRLYGNVDIREVELSFRQPGRVAEMAFDEGDNVIAGEVMARLDAGPYDDRVAAAEAGLQAAMAERDKLLSGNRPQEIVQAEEGVRQTEAAANETERNFKRQDSLLESGASSQRTVDAARAARDQAAANLAAARAAL